MTLSAYRSSPHSYAPKSKQFLLEKSSIKTS
jgi:hypothetical protein